MGKLAILGISIHNLQYGFFHNSLENKKCSVFLQITHHLLWFLRLILSCTQRASHSTDFSCVLLVVCCHFSLMLRALKKKDFMLPFLTSTNPLAWLLLCFPLHNLFPFLIIALSMSLKLFALFSFSGGDTLAVGKWGRHSLWQPSDLLEPMILHGGTWLKSRQRELALGLLLEFRRMKSFLSPGVHNPIEY